MDKNTFNSDQTMSPAQSETYWSETHREDADRMRQYKAAVISKAQAGALGSVDAVDFLRNAHSEAYTCIWGELNRANRENMPARRKLVQLMRTRNAAVDDWHRSLTPGRTAAHVERMNRRVLRGAKLAAEIKALTQPPA